MTNATGPYLNAALICERVLTEQDGVITPVRVIDRVLFGTGADGLPVDPEYPVYFYIGLRAGAARGSFAVEVDREAPSGVSSSAFTMPIFMEDSQDRGVNIVVKAKFAPDEPGLYWYDIYFANPMDGTRSLLTRVPLRAIYQAQPTLGPRE